MSGRAVSAAFFPAPEDAESIERPNVTRGEALALVDRFWAEVEAARAGAFAPDSEITLSFSRDPEGDFIEFSVFDPRRFSGRHRYVHAWKLLGLIPMRTQQDRHLLFTAREEVADFVEAWLTASDPRTFGDDMLRRGATRSRADLAD